MSMSLDEIKRIQAELGVFLWVREDGKRPKSIQPGSRPRAPGKVVAVQGCRNARQARPVLENWRRAQKTTDDELAELAKTDPMEAGVLLAARSAVTEIATYVRNDKGRIVEAEE